MPNHVTNILNLNGSKEQIKNLLENLKIDDEELGSIDFNKIIPMPESLKIEAGSRTQKGLALYSDFIQTSSAIAAKGLFSSIDEHDAAVRENNAKFEKLRKDDPELWEIGETAFNNLQDYGHATWYDWSVANWGTKWNSYSPYYDGESTVSFQTAWSAPTPVINRIAEMYPDMDIYHQWADEDLGYNCGEREYADGELIGESLFNGGAKEALEFAAEVWNYDLAEMGYRLSEDSTEYEWHDPDEDESESMKGMEL